MKHKARRNKSAAQSRRKKKSGSNDDVDVNPVKQISVDEEDLKGVQQWIASLTFESLINALEFTFQPNGGNPDHLEQNNDRWGSRLWGNTGSHEFDLLMEMLSLQRPAYNGIDEVEKCYAWRRSIHAKFETPCLFRWADSVEDKHLDSNKLPEEVNNQDEPKPVPSNNDSLSFLAKGSAEMPSELMDILAKAGVKRSTSALLETFNEADEMDKAFWQLDDGQNITSKKDIDEPTNFYVKVDNWISDDGEPLGRGTTIEQQNADKSMLLWTTLFWDRTLGSNAEKTDSRNANIEGKIPRCTLNVAGNSTENEQQCKKMVLKTLLVASRGKFLSTARQRRQEYMAPWFDPTQQWFSLSMYLASRFESSLWDAYSQRSEMADPKKNSLVHSVINLDEDAIKRVLCHAIGIVMRNEIGSQSITADFIQGSLLRKLLIWSENSNMLPRTHIRLDEFALTPLLEWDTPLSELKPLVMDHLQEGLAHEAERSLMQSMPTEGTRKSKNKKKKKRQKKKGRHANQLTTNVLADAHSEDDQFSEDEELHVECILPGTPLSTPTDFCEPKSLDHSPQNEINSTKMTVLKVLDDILSEVFVKLGVRDGEFSDFTDAVTVKSRGESFQQEFTDPSVEKTRSADEIDLPATVPSKVGASAGAIVNHRHFRAKSQQPKTSKSRRQTLGASQKDVSHLKRSKSSGDGSMFEKKSPNYPRKVYQPTLPKSSHDGTPLCPSSDSAFFPQASQSETSIFDGAPLCLSGALGGWNSVACQKENETNIFTDLLRNKEEIAKSECDQQYLVSSTAASIASSRVNVEDTGLDIDGDCGCVDSHLLQCDDALGPDGSDPSSDVNKAVHFKDIKVQNLKNVNPAVELPKQPTDKAGVDGDILAGEHVGSPLPEISAEPLPNMELSPTPSAPPTPPPQLSPILVSLADLGKLREEAASGEFKKKVDELPSIPLPVNSIPKPQTTTAMPRSMTPSLSRDDLRSIDKCRKPPRRDRDDHHAMGHRQVDALLSYRNVVAQSAPRKPPSVKSYDGIQKHRDDHHPIMTRSTRSIKTAKTTRSGMWPPGRDFPNLSASVSSMPSYKEPILNKVLHLDVACARSEGGLDGVEDASHCNVIPRVQTDDTMTRDGATTISSVHSPPETEQLDSLKEERNSYRDMCLTLGAENAKLRNLLASKTCVPLHPTPFAHENLAPNLYRNDQQFWPTHNGFPNQFSTQSIVAMSDAGIHRGDYDSLAMSEDGTDVHPSFVAIGESQNSVSWQPRGDSVQSFGRRTSGGGTYAESDTSLEHNAGGQESTMAFSGFHNVHQQDSFFGPIPLHGMQSRLSKDISRYMQSLRSQLKKNEPRRLWAVEGVTKIVKALWPRAQIKMYGSHVTNLCLPSSDMDFVISLPAVHKNAPATAPGDLEGRNAIIETNQRVLARKLKSESWLDQRSIKVIERTAVPVIKVSTKESRSRVVQLDLSFDAKEHHGLECAIMIKHILEQLPMVRPLVLVLKQFLLDRGLLAAYTGGLSSYCLFLMVTRYCQEQAPSWNDCGSLLMGLLDFYGNFFDPRTTGISVRTRQYFFRSPDAQHSSEEFAEAQGWNAPHQTQFPDLTKRNSFSSKPHRFQHLQRQMSFQSTQQNTSQHPAQQFKSGKFDPIWVEDPLNPGNNVGRNAFRIFQVQRAFSDAHRALVASLEWDVNSMDEFGDDGEYPLLKCLLQNEDVFLAIDDPIHR